MMGVESESQRATLKWEFKEEEIHTFVEERSEEWGTGRSWKMVPPVGISLTRAFSAESKTKIPLPHDAQICLPSEFSTRQTH